MFPTFIFRLNTTATLKKDISPHLKALRNFSIQFPGKGMSARSVGLVSDQIILSDPTNWVLTNRKHTGLRSNILIFDNHRGISHFSLPESVQANLLNLVQFISLGSL